MPIDNGIFKETARLLVLYRSLRRFMFLKAALGREPFYLRDVSPDTEFHGSSYGGWAILKDSLRADSVVYSFGLGRDVSFDMSLIRKYGCRVFGFDPTPKSIEWVRHEASHPNFQTQPVALAKENGKLRMYQPQAGTADEVSASAAVTNIAHRDYFDADCRNLETLLQSHTQGRCDYLKLDIEGSEYEVLEQAVENKSLANVGQLAVEFHHWMIDRGCSATKRVVEMLRRDGYRIAWISRTNHEYLFVR